jgi:hypothetical protein
LLGIVDRPTQGCPTKPGGTNLCALRKLGWGSQTPYPYDAYSLAIPILLLLTTRTADRNYDWADPERFYIAEMNTAGPSVQMLNNLAIHFMFPRAPARCVRSREGNASFQRVHLAFANARHAPKAVPRDASNALLSTSSVTQDSPRLVQSARCVPTEYCDRGIPPRRPPRLTAQVPGQLENKLPARHAIA